MEALKNTLENQFEEDLRGQDLSKQRAYLRLKRKYALPHAGTREYDQMVRKITDFLEL